MNVAYTWSKAFGICCDQLSRQSAAGSGDGLLRSERSARSTIDRPHNFQASFVAELPFGPGKPFLNNGGVAPRCGRLAGQRAAQRCIRGTPFTVTSAATSLNMPGSTQLADQVKATSRSSATSGRASRTSIRSPSRRSRRRASATPGYNTHARPGLRQPRLQRVSPVHARDRARRCSSGRRCST